MGADQSEMAAGLVEEHEACRIDARSELAPGCPRGFVLLRGAQGLFAGSSRTADG
jgi:hypothetical protein